jgi:hypothetical protein
MKYEKEVRAGIALLDYGQFYGANWRDKIYWEDLSLTSYSRCVLGQLEQFRRGWFVDEIRFHLVLKRLGLSWNGGTNSRFYRASADVRKLVEPGLLDSLQFSDAYVEEARTGRHV